MPRKGMKSLCFTYKRRSSSSSSAYSSSAANNKDAADDSSSSSASTLRSEAMTIQRAVDIAELMVSKWNPDASGYAKVTSLFYESRQEALEFIKCVNNLQKSMHLLLLSGSSPGTLIRAQTLMQIAMKRLQKEFYQILSTNRAHLDPESVSAATSSRTSVSSSSISDFYDEGTPDDEIIRAAADSLSEVEQVSMLAMENLRCIAECMIASGYGKECIEIYNIIRKSIVDEGVYKLGIERISPGQLNKFDWEIQEMKIINWLNAFKISIKTLFHGERILCDHVFGAANNIRESCFAEISKDGAALLFGFPETVAKTKKCPHKIFRTLDMYAAIVDNWTDIESIFSFESSSPVRSHALSSLAKLAESVRTMLSEFETGVLKDSSGTPPSGGGVHILTNYAMNYLSVLSDHGGVLSDILANPPKKPQLPASYFDVSDLDDSPAPSATVHVAWLILGLLCKLDSKSKQYKKNVALSYLFLANNLQHIVGKVRTSANLKYMLGDDWISRHEEKVRQFASNYERLGWSHVYAALPDDAAASVASKDEVRSLFEKFNRSFEDAFKKQRHCVIPDTKLRDEIKASIAGKIVPKYREFYEMHKNDGAVRRERTMRLIIRFEPEDVAHYISDLFFVDGERDRMESTTSVSSSSSDEQVVDVDPAVLGISFRFSTLELE